VAGADGATTLGQVLAAMQLADTARDRFNLRVLNVSLGAPADDPATAPLTEAVERLWADGITVVAAAGNDGGGVDAPGLDPHVVTVGALDPAAGTVPAWSSRGPDFAGRAKPDLVAPGVGLVGLRAPGSTIDLASPGARVGERYFRGSGTSMSTAVVAGAAAVVSAAHPDWGPDRVKAALTATASPLGQGAGALDLGAALAAVPARPANGDLFPLRAVGRARGAQQAAAREERGESGRARLAGRWARRAALGAGDRVARADGRGRRRRGLDGSALAERGLGRRRLVAQELGGPAVAGPGLGGPQVGHGRARAGRLGRAPVVLGRGAGRHPRPARARRGGRLGGPQLGGPQLGRARLGAGRPGRPELGRPLLGRAGLGGEELGCSQLGRPRLDGQELGVAPLGGGRLGHDRRSRMTSRQPPGRDPAAPAGRDDRDPIPRPGGPAGRNDAKGG
jgi:hypothetical protein